MVIKETKYLSWKIYRKRQKMNNIQTVISVNCTLVNIYTYPLHILNKRIPWNILEEYMGKYRELYMIRIIYNMHNLVP